MRVRAVRRFGLLDAMALVGALGLGFALARWLCRGFFGGDGSQVAGVVMAGALPMTAAVVSLGLRKPRPTLRRLASQPGFAACIAALLAFVYGVASRTFLDDIPPNSAQVAFTYGLRDAASWPTVLVVWALLLLGRRWRAEPTWIDRLKRVLAVLWILNYPLAKVADRVIMEYFPSPITDIPFEPPFAPSSDSPTRIFVSPLE